MARRHPRYATLTSTVGLLLVAGGPLAYDRGWIKLPDTAAAMVAAGLYAIARRRTKSREMDISLGILETLLVRDDSMGDRRVNRGER